MGRSCGVPTHRGWTGTEFSFLFHTFFLFWLLIVLCGDVCWAMLAFIANTLLLQCPYNMFFFLGSNIRLLSM